MAAALGIDTSNYTTSAAVYDPASGTAASFRRLLPVKAGAHGLRQSDAVFHHVQQLPDMLAQAFAATRDFACIGVSDRPRAVQGSYMPCFTAGVSAAKSLAALLGVPLYFSSHQAGHIAAALYSCGRLDLLERPFLAFHVSGGTTEALLVEPHPDEILTARAVARSLDLKAGQAVDRVGAMLGLSFPAGRELDALAVRSTARFQPKPVFKGKDPCLSGLENQCERMLSGGASACDVAAYVIQYLEAVLSRMTELLLAEYGPLPLLYAGGVMSNSQISKSLEEKFGGLFAQPEFSADNAAGAAVLAALRHDRTGKAGGTFGG